MDIKKELLKELLEKKSLSTIDIIKKHNLKENDFKREISKLKMMGFVSIKEDKITIPKEKEVTVKLFLEKRYNINIKGEKTNCIFCNIANKQEKAFIIDENEKAVAFLDIDPINDGHVLIITKNHFLDIDEIDDETLLQTMKLTKQILKRIRAEFKMDGYTIMQNGGKFNDTGHFHLHIFKREEGDGFNFTYGEEEKLSLNEVYKKLSQKN